MHQDGDNSRTVRRTQPTGVKATQGYGQETQTDLSDQQITKNYALF